MSSRPDIEQALCIRSDETVVVLAHPDSDYEYPAHWVRPQRLQEIIDAVSPQTVVVVDRLELSRKVLAAVGAKRPRLVAVAPLGIEGEKSVRRMVTALYPWSEVWVFTTNFGKLLVTKDVTGPAYDRDTVVDLMDPGEA